MDLDDSHNQELQRIINVYGHRDIDSDVRYSLLDQSYLLTIQERDRAFSKFMNKHDFVLNDQTRALDVGGGSGKGGRWFVELGIQPANIVVNDLIPERVAHARTVLPASVSFSIGDACELSYADKSIDLILLSVVFSSILDKRVQIALANKMWRLLKPGGGILWYDFVVSNPSNNDVAGLGLSRIRELFPDASIKSKRVTLAPPISRLVCRVHPMMYSIFNSIPVLRSHLVCWISH